MEASVVTASTGNTGPLGQPRGVGFGILMFIVTIGFYGWYWIYKTMEEIGRHVGQGLGGVLSLVIWILIQPVTRHAINRLRGILKRKPGGKSFAEEWADHKREELELEERKYARSTGSR